MSWEHYILAIDLGTDPPCFCPVELDELGDIQSIVWGMNIIQNRCPGNLIAVAGQAMSQEEVEKWVEENPDWYERYRKEDSE